MASIISAGNATNGLAISSDNTGILQLKTGTGAGTTGLTIDASQNATFAGTAAVPTGTLYPIVSGTAVASTSGTSIDFTSIPSWVKRVTVMLFNVSTNGTSGLLAQIGSGSIQTSGYVAAGSTMASTVSSATSTAGFPFGNPNTSTAAATFHANLIITNISGNNWVASVNGNRDATNTINGGGGVTLSGALDRLRVTSSNGTDTFDAGTINILWE